MVLEGVKPQGKSCSLSATVKTAKCFKAKKCPVVVPSYNILVRIGSLSQCLLEHINKSTDGSELNDMKWK